MTNDDITNDPLAPRKPDWGKWQTVRTAKLWHAIALACDLDPGNFPFFDIEKRSSSTLALNYPAIFINLLTRAKNDLGPNGQLKAISLDLGNPEESLIKLSNFAGWLKALGHRPPAEFHWMPEEMPHSNLDWPWGRHETELLRKLAAAANRFWKNYNPNEIDTAPTNKQVSDWLIEQGVATRTAEVMASILRADGLPTGPRS